MKLSEMAFNRAEAIDICMSIGKRFAEHFDKIYNSGDNQFISHLCSEMQAWYDKMRSIKLSYNNKSLNFSQRYNWFYTFGSSYEFIFHENYDEEIAFEEFIDLLNVNNNVCNSIKEVLHINF